jgi:hypothetical protein
MPAKTQTPFTAGDVAGEAIDLRPPATPLDKALDSIFEVSPEATVLHVEPGATYLVLLGPDVDTARAQTIAKALHAVHVRGCLVRVPDPAAIRVLRLEPAAADS